VFRYEGGILVGNGEWFIASDDEWIGRFSIFKFRVRNFFHSTAHDICSCDLLCYACRDTT
jgi:hypothetical protein